MGLMNGVFVAPSQEDESRDLSLALLITALFFLLLWASVSLSVTRAEFRDDYVWVQPDHL
jgi:hypothetical protein